MVILTYLLDFILQGSNALAQLQIVEAIAIKYKKNINQIVCQYNYQCVFERNSRLHMHTLSK